MRKLATVRKINALTPIEGADAIECAAIDGWKVVVKKGEFAVNDPCVYFEIDSFLPETDPRYSFLMKSSREFEGVRGHRLRTVKLRGQISQGLALPVSAFPEIEEQEDLDGLLGIKKWEAAIPAALSGVVKSTFPSFIQKTDQERCQNMGNEIFGYDDQVFDIDLSAIPEDAQREMVTKGILIEVDGVLKKLVKAKANRHARYEITTKLDGSSCTIYFNNGEMGVCSRNQELQIGDENKGNTFVRMFYDNLFNVTLPTIGKNIAVQGEVMGPGIQGNRENLPSHQFYVFDIYDIDAGRYLSCHERYALLETMKVAAPNLRHAPVLAQGVTLEDMEIHSVEDLLEFAEGPSLTHPVREGVVFKRVDGGFSFKAISNAFLAKEKD